MRRRSEISADYAALSHHWNTVRFPPEGTEKKVTVIERRATRWARVLLHFENLPQETRERTDGIGAGVGALKPDYTDQADADQNHGPQAALPPPSAAARRRG